MIVIIVIVIIKGGSADTSTFASATAATDASTFVATVQAGQSVGAGVKVVFKPSIIITNNRTYIINSLVKSSLMIILGLRLHRQLGPAEPRGYGRDVHVSVLERYGGRHTIVMIDMVILP